MSGGFYGKAFYELGDVFKTFSISKYLRWPLQKDENNKPQGGANLVGFDVGSIEDTYRVKQGNYPEGRNIIPVSPDSFHDQLLFRTDDPHIYLGSSGQVNETNEITDVISFQHGMPYFDIGSAPNKNNMSNEEYKEKLDTWYNSFTGDKSIFNPELMKPYELSIVSTEDNKSLNLFSKDSVERTLNINNIYIDKKGHVGVDKSGNLLKKPTTITFKQLTLPNNFGTISVNTESHNVYGKLFKYITDNKTLTADSPSDTLSIKPGHHWIKVSVNSDNYNDILGLYHSAALGYDVHSEKVYAVTSSDTSLSFGTAIYNTNTSDKNQMTVNNSVSLGTTELIFDNAGHIMVPVENGKTNLANFYKFTLPTLTEGYGIVLNDNGDGTGKIISHTDRSQLNFDVDVSLLPSKLEYGKKFSITKFKSDNYGHIKTDGTQEVELPALPNSFGQVSIGNSNIKSTTPNDILIFVEPAKKNGVKIEVTNSNAIAIRHTVVAEQSLNKQVVLLEGNLEFGQEYSIPCFNIDSECGHIETPSNTKFIMPALQANEKAWIKIQSNSQIAHATCNDQKQHVNTIYKYHAFTSSNYKLLFGDVITSNDILFDSVYGHIYSIKDNTGVNYTLPSLSCDDKWLQIELKENTNQYVVSHKKPYIDTETVNVIATLIKSSNSDNTIQLSFGDTIAATILALDETGHVVAREDTTKFRLPTIEDIEENITINQTITWETW